MIGAVVWIVSLPETLVFKVWSYIGASEKLWELEEVGPGVSFWSLGPCP